MIIMDVKGGSWVGGMYQKFEAMCVEVEEAMYEDTFKYVGSQVRTVGETVKKFYSDVMQDLLPPSPSDQSEDALSSVFHQSEIKLSKKPKVLDENESEKLVKDFGVASAHEDSIYVTSCTPLFSVIKPCRPRSIYSGGEKSAKENSRGQGTEIILSNQAPDEAKHTNSFKDSEEECISSLPSIDKTITDICRPSFTESRYRSDESTYVNEVSSSKEVPAMSQNEEFSRPVTTALNGHLSTDLVSLTEDDLTTTSTSSVENTIEVDKELSKFDKETSSSFLDTEYRLCENDEGLLVEQLNEVKLGESCVLVEKNDNFSKSGLQSVRKSYKKKIQDVLSPRRWSKSKRDQEELADWYNKQCGKSSVSTTNMTLEQPQKSLMSESFESDWELL